MSKIILVDDESHILAVLERLFRADHEVTTETDPQIAWSLIEKQPFDLMITDIRMEPIDGMQLCKHAKEVCPQMPVIILTGFGTEESFEEAMKLGAFGFMNKPFKLVELRTMAQNALARHAGSAADLSSPQDQSRHTSGGGSVADLVAESAAMQALREKVSRVALKDSPVLICGENGTGKTRIANILHAISNRQNGPFIAINCAEQPEPLLDLELFGYTKEAFMAAPDGCSGILAESANGVAYLKEFTWLSSRLQSKLTDALANQSFHPVKGAESIPLRCRLIVSAIGKLDQIRLENHLQRELLARMADWDCISIPPLRDRNEDILALILQFIQDAPDSEQGTVWQVETEALQFLQEYAWPGNLPELRMFTRKAVAICSNNTISLKEATSLLTR